jgi:hypothetical protein
VNTVIGQHEDPRREQEVHHALRSYRDSAPKAFVPPPAETFSDRATRRRQGRIMVGAATAVLAVVTGAVGVIVANTPGPGPAAITGPSGTPVPDTFAPEPTGTAEPHPYTSPKNVVVADAALLRPQDIGPGYTATPDMNFGWMDGWGLRGVVQECPHEWGSLSYSQNGDRALRFDGPRRVSQHVNISEEAQARRELNNFRAVATACADFRRDDRHITMRLVGENFAGDESMLIELIIADGFSTTTRYHAFVRRGAVYTEIAMAGDPQDLKALAGKAVERMCGSLACT